MKAIDTTVHETRVQGRGVPGRRRGGCPVTRERLTPDEVGVLRRRCAASSVAAVARAAGVGAATLENAISGALVTHESAAALRALIGEVQP